MRALLPLATLALLAGCATTPGTDRLAERDPLQGFNRAVWGFNRGVDKVVLKPVSGVYRTIAPRPARRGISRLFANLSEPWSAINNLLQGKPDRAVRNLGRFVVNTTIGVGGLADHATKMGIRPAPEDFGQTLARWGVNGGPYLVLPILGPSTLRDGVGAGVAQLADPYRVCLRECGPSSTVRWSAQGLEIVSLRSSLTESGADGLLDDSLDSYATAKSAYLQRRRAAILDREDAVAAIPPVGPADATKEAADAVGGDAALDAALSDIRAEQAEQGETPAAAPADPAPATAPPPVADPAPPAPSPSGVTP
ncbi:MAG: VacJ family lipoprotein [Sphingomonas sp.]